MRTRNLMTSLVIPIMVAIAVGVAVVVVAGANNGSGTLAPPELSAGFPPARIATADFTATKSLAGRGISLPLTQVAAVGSDIVAVGAQSGGQVGRVRFLFSADNGHTWRLAPVQGPDGTAPPPGQGPVLVAGGPAGWVAISPDSSFTSQDGTAWTSRPAISLQPGDVVSALVAAGTGFVAVGQNDAAGASSPVIWLSANGTSWRRLSGAQLSLPVPAGTRVLGVTHAAANGTIIMLSGTVTSAMGQASAAWRSTDGGTTWAAVTIPDDPGAATMIAGVAALRNGFVAARTARVNGATGALVYTSPDGAAWTRSAAITTADGAALTIGQVAGGAQGAVIEGSANGLLIAFLSANGANWLGTSPLGIAPDEQVGGVAVTSAGQAVIAGSAGGAAGVAADSQPVLTLIGAAGGPDQVDVTAIPGVTQSQVAVSAIAASGATQVAVGSADGFPAVWSSPDGGSTWARGTQATATTLNRAGLARLTGVAHGPAGWVAVGGPAEAGTDVAVPGPPVVVGSVAGSAWTKEDGTAAFAAPGLVTSAVAASGAGYVIVGWQAAGGQATARAWFSAGLAGWRPVPVPAKGGDTRLNAVAATGGGFVTVGAASTHPAAWISPSGKAWRQVTLALPAGAVSASLSLAAANGATVAAAGTEVTTAGQRLPFAAMSADGGATWQEEALPAPGGAASATLAVSALTAAGTGFTATGTAGPPGNQDVVIWARNPVAGGGAASGAWMAVTPAGYGLSGAGMQAITALAPAGSTLTGAGFTATQASEAPTIWQSPIRG